MRCGIQCGLALLLLVSMCIGAAVAQDVEPQRRILVLYEMESTAVSVSQVARGVETGLRKAFPDGLELYAEYLDLVRFPSEENAQNLATSLNDRFRDVPLDLVIVVGPLAVAFWTDRLPNLHRFPLIYGGVRPDSPELKTLPAATPRVASGFDLVRTVELARRLQPDARRLVVMTGSSTFDKRWESNARTALEGKTPGLEVEFATGLTREGFKTVAEGLGRDSMIVFLTVSEDADGRKFRPYDLMVQVAAVAGAPTYSVYSSYIGSGAVGGYVQTFIGIGEKLAELAADTLSGNPPPPGVVEPHAGPVVDWRQMQRWGMSRNLLPEGTDLQFYEPSAWERYRLPILLAGAVILLQALTIAALVIQDRRRRRAEGELAVERESLTHLSRAWQLGELSGALAHELNQPLTAILANAQAGSALLRRRPQHEEQLGAILADIAKEDRRAAGIIAQLRRLMVKGDTALEVIDLNQVVASTVALAASEFVARQATVEVAYEQATLPVNGNFAQLQQVVLNLLLNASEAMVVLPPDERRVTISTRLLGTGKRELAIADNGPGLSDELRRTAFQPFVSTKASGLGFGLSICRTIAHAHAGTLVFDDAPRSGLRVVLTLPPV